MISEAAEILATALEADAAAQEAGRHDDIATGYDDVYAKILPMNDIPGPLFNLAFRFWDDWCDARNHNWLYHEPMTEKDWPRVARIIARSLRLKKLPEDEKILAQFLPEPRVSLFGRFKSWWSKNA